MYKKTLSCLLLASAIGLSDGSAIAAAADKPLDEGLPPPVFLLDAPGGPGIPPPHGPGFGGGPGGPAQEVIQTLAEIERLYRQQGKTREVLALYQDVLGKTKNPLVRHFAYEGIAHTQLQPTESDKAVATLRQSLDESLQRLNQLPPPPGGPGQEGKAP